jgi:hypothetical protein
MKDLVLAIKDQLADNLVWVADCQIVTDESMIPATVRFPFVGIKDGTIKRSEGVDESISETLTVDIIAYQKILKPEVSVVGMTIPGATHEVVYAEKKATSLTLAINAIPGATPAERLANVKQIKVRLGAKEWTSVVFSAVSDATPAVITIEAPDTVDGSAHYAIDYFIHEQITTPGILDMIEDIHDELNHNYLGVEGICGAFCSGESASETVYDDKTGFLQKKRCTYVYEKET